MPPKFVSCVFNEIEFEYIPLELQDSEKSIHCRGKFSGGTVYWRKNLYTLIDFMDVAFKFNGVWKWNNKSGYFKAPPKEFLESWENAMLRWIISNYKEAFSELEYQSIKLIT